MIHFQPNTPYCLRIADPEGSFDFEAEVGNYQTVDGERFQLPRSAVVKLNAVGVKRGEEVQITKHWSGRRGELPEWTIALSTRSEVARAKEEEDLCPQLEASIERVKQQKPAVPIRQPERKQPVSQPKLFDQRGTGTHGPAPTVAPSPAPARPQRQLIPVNVAVREILGFVDPLTKNWSDQARQDLLSTILIAEYKAGRIGVWERGGRE